MMKDALFAGVNAAVLTPMRADLSIDLDRMAKHCRWLLANGCNNLGVLGTTGEANSIGLQERMDALQGLIERGIPAAKMMPGTGVAALTDTVVLTRVTLLGDWSIRSPAEPTGPLRFGMAKNFDQSCSLGPCIVVGELDPTDVEVETYVNGERRQQFNTRDMVFSFWEYIEYLSRDLTLYPGDIISGGTAAGTAADSSPRLADGNLAPERFLKPGDLVRITSPAIGTLETRIVVKP